MVCAPRIEVPYEALAAFCRRHGIRRLSLFGSVLREDFGPESDIDLLVEFEPERVPSLLELIRMQRELSKLVFRGRAVDLVLPEELGRCFRDRVLSEARVAYDAA